MKNKKLMINKKGQFSIIAALLVAVVLITAVMTTYSAIRYSPFQEQPQMLSSVDEINLALKKVLGFTVGYYGSVLQVTGNTSYAKTLASNYLGSGLENIADLRPEWGPSFNVTTLDLQTNWFTNASYSSGNITVKYDLTGIGVYNMTYTASSRLDVNILQSPNINQACLSINKDENEPLINIGKDSFKFYEYLYSNSTWQYESLISEPTTFTNGTYLLEIPSDLDPTAFILKIEDTRGIMVIASSFSRYTSTLTWNTTSVEQGFHFVDNNSSDVDGLANIGSNGNFTAQQYGPDNINDTLTEAPNGNVALDSFPSYWNALGLTTCPSGTISDLQSNNGVYMNLRSYATQTSSQTLYAHQETTTISGSNYNLLKLNSGDTTGQTLSQSARTTGRKLLGSFVFSLTGMSSIPASTWTTYYRARSQDSTVVAHCDVDVLVRRSNGNVRATIATNTANSARIGTSYSTLSATYAFAAYTVVDPTDYLEVDYYTEVTTRNNVNPAPTVDFRIDDNTLALVDQTRVTNINLPSEWTSQAEFTGQSTATNLRDLVWTIDSAASVDGVTVTYQLYDFAAGSYPLSGGGYLTGTVGTTPDVLNTQNITVNYSNFKNSTNYWKLRATAVKTTTTQFDLKLDFVKYSPDVPNYSLSLEEQWINVNATNPRQDLCIKTGNFGSEGLILDVWYGGSWRLNVLTLVSNRWNNVSLVPYIDSTTLSIRFRGTSETADPVQDTWPIDAAFIKPQANIDFLINLQESTFTCEVLQNGTMNWLGQHIQFSTNVMPIPPLAVKAIHINQTISGVNQEVPFQVEDWSSNYQIPLGMTSNATVFSSNQMIVFLLSNKVTEFTIWWDGRDVAVQTPNAFTIKYFTNDNTATHALSNGKINLKLVTDPFTVTSTVVGTTTSSTANFMRINNQPSTYGATEAYVIHHGIVRDIVQQEAEWGNGVSGSPNLYANIIITLPANTTYYTYQLRLMFINSTKPRAVTDICPIRLTTSLGSLQTQTENGTIGGFPIIQNGTGTFSNYASGGNLTAHHWSQFVTDAGTQGAGIMFTDKANLNLYAFDSIAGSATGALSATSSSLIELLPVKLAQAQFTYPLDITWSGAVATFDNTTPICGLQGGTTPTGLWILAEYPPTLTVTARS